MKISTCALMAMLACHAAQAAPLRDPFARPPMQALPAPAEQAPTDILPVLRAVMVAPGQSMANISGQIVAVGEWVGPYRVLRIDERSVTLVRGKTKSVLVLDRESSK